MRLHFRGWPVLAAVWAMSSCGSNDAALPPSNAVPLLPGDEQIAAALYSGATRTPVGFVSDPAPPSYAQVTTYHLKSSQLALPAATTHEVCTDDWSTALAWSEHVASQANPYLDLAANDATAGYFEFGRVPRGLTRPVRAAARVSLRVPRSHWCRSNGGGGLLRRLERATARRGCDARARRISLAVHELQQRGACRAHERSAPAGTCSHA